MCTQLESLYSTVDDIDAIIGMLAEDTRPSSSVGETVSAVLVDQFERLREGDRLYYENNFTSAEIKQIESTRLSDIIERNTTMTDVRENVFTLMNTPEAVDDKSTTDMNQAISIDVLTNDFDPEGDRLRLHRIATPANGTAKIVNGKLLYTPDKNFVGQEVFDYSISDGNSTDTATVRINVKNATPPDPRTAKLGNRVWWDVDNDGRQDRKEKGIVGVNVILTGAGPDGQFETPDDSSEMTTTGKKRLYVGLNGREVTWMSGAAPTALT